MPTFLVRLDCAQQTQAVKQQADRQQLKGVSQGSQAVWEDICGTQGLIWRVKAAWEPTVAEQHNRAKTAMGVVQLLRTQRAQLLTILAGFFARGEREGYSSSAGLEQRETPHGLGVGFSVARVAYSTNRECMRQVSSTAIS